MKTNTLPKAWFITGTSSGFGRMLTEKLRSSLTLAALANDASRLHGGLGQVPGDLSYAV